NPDIWDTLSVAHHGLEAYAEARRAGRVAVCLEPRSAELWNNLATVLVELEDYAAAERAFGAALGRNPSLLPASLGLCSCLLRDRRYGGASAVFRRLLVLARPSAWWPEAGGWPGAPAPVASNSIKLRHDIEQIAYVRRRGVLGAEFDPILASYRRVLKRFEAR